MNEPNTIRWTQECNSCKGTGLYIGMAERSGSAVICHNCKGTGRLDREIKYHPFTGRNERTEDIGKIFQTSAGMVLGGMMQGGITPEEFEEDPAKAKEPGREPRDYICPAWWYQSADYEKKPEWDECKILGSFKDCVHFPNKDKCWVRWDAEFGGGDEKVDAQ